MKTSTQVVLFLLFLVVSMPILAEKTSRYPIREDAVWRINYEYSFMDDGFAHQEGDEEYQYFIKGDTTINSKTYYKLYKSGILYLESPLKYSGKYKGAIRDSADRFYFVWSGKATEELLYEFSAKVGESICPGCSGPEYLVGEIDTLEDGRKRYHIDIITVNCGSANTLIEGIGWLGGLLEGNACYSHPGIRGSYLLCYSENGIPVYKSDYSFRYGGKKVNCDLDLTSVRPLLPIGEIDVSWVDGGFLSVCMPDKLGGQYTIELFTVSGKRVYKTEAELPGMVEMGSFTRGTYLVRIGNGRGESGSWKIMVNGE